MRGVIISKSYVVAAQQGFANGRQKGLTDSSDALTNSSCNCKPLVLHW